MANRCPGAAPRAGLGPSGISRLGAGTPSAGRMARPQSSPSPSPSFCPGASASRLLTPRASPLRPTGPARCKALQSESYSRRVRSLTRSTARRGACPSATSMASAASAASLASSPSRCRLPPAARARSPCPGQQQSSAYAAPSPRAVAAAATPRFNVSAPTRFAQRPRPFAAAHTSCPATADSWVEYSEPMLEDEEPPWEMSDAWDYDMDVGEEDEFYDDWENSGPSWSVGTAPPWSMDSSPPWPPPNLSSTPRPAYYSTSAAGGPGACQANPRCQPGGGDETSGAAETIIENLRCQEEHEVQSLMRNLADLQSFRRQALSHALPHTPFLRQPARPEQLAARLAARALPPPCAASSPRSGAMPADPALAHGHAHPAAAPLHGAYSQELFDAGRM